MDAKAESFDVAMATAANADSPHASEPRKLLGALLDQACSVCLRLAVLVFLVYSFVQTARRVRGDPWDLAFAVAAYADLGMLFLCLRRVEQLTPASPTGERRRLQFTVWALSTVLSCAFAYRVCKIMPPALVVAIWCVTTSVVLVGFYCLVVYNDPGLEDCDASDAKSFHKIPADEIV